MMVSLQSSQSQHTLDVFQFLFRCFHDFKQSVYASTLWVCDSGIVQPLSLDLQESRTLLILHVQWHHRRGSLDLQFIPETILARGDRLDPHAAQTDAGPLLPAFRFQSLIPLPNFIQPQTAIAELSGTTLGSVLHLMITLITRLNQTRNG
jgi:hypothetical protein